jgi:hypothetical protein
MKTSFASTPHDGEWYELPDCQFIRWNFELGMWDWMVVRDGQAIDHAQIPEGAELFGV